MHVTIRTSHDATQALRKATASPAVEELLRATQELGVAIRPMHPTTQDPELASFFRADEPDRQAAQIVINRLRGVRGVSAAYAKPMGSPPAAKLP